ncbi:hypothetical protein [Dactylosporangium cerinum]
MPEPVIELDLSSPWEPPEPPPVLRFRLRTRWVAACAVLAVAAGVLAASGAKPRTGPLYSVDEHVVGVTVAKDMLFVNRHRLPGGDPTIEGRRRSDGKVLWSITTDQEQQYAMVSATALILIRHFRGDRGYTTTLTAVDQATGRQLWTRPRTSVLGTRGGLVVAEEMTDPGRITTIAMGESPDLTVNQAADGPARHILVLDERSGAPVWELTAPPGVVFEFTWDGRYPVGQVTGVDQLDPSGLVSSRDIRSGVVVATHQLDWSGIPAAFRTGPDWYAAPGRGAARAVVHPDGQPGGIVFDLAGGRPCSAPTPRCSPGSISAPPRCSAPPAAAASPPTTPPPAGRDGTSTATPRSPPSSATGSSSARSIRMPGTDRSPSSTRGPAPSPRSSAAGG